MEIVQLVVNHTYSKFWTRFYIWWKQLSAGGNADDNGNGDFKYAPPSGFLAICSANLPISA